MPASTASRINPPDAAGGGDDYIADKKFPAHEYERLGPSDYLGTSHDKRSDRNRGGELDVELYRDLAVVFHVGDGETERMVDERHKGAAMHETVVVVVHRAGNDADGARRTPGLLPGRTNRLYERIGAVMHPPPR